MQTVSSPQLSIELEDINSVETAFQPALNDLGLRNWKTGHGLPAMCTCQCCCSCCAASGEELLSE